MIQEPDYEKERKGILELIYEGCMVILAIGAVATIWHQTKYDSVIIWGTWAIFFVDFLYRIYHVENKLQFIKSNPFIIIAIIPLDAIFQMARIARILHFLRLKVITKYYTKPVIEKIRKQHFSDIIPGVFFVLFASIIPLYLLEPGLESYVDAFIGGLASLVFFGYSTIDPQTTVGTVIITLLTIFGVIMHGVILSYLFSIIGSLSVVKKWKEKSKMNKPRNHA
ncbi:hypothetical protein CR203_13830 [Salipaludibacillus neizhouensis]|uniref:Voltage-gated potassium channel n=1 Tax=Salipaludibacillus neizhouensis TaxID=885475 RepID=A0A3A9K1D4_9BACI|nr:hypothetical protein [Salipaludibacillus neizhouensis]RKL66904.1 hypothetical protein CR203_13830 [Salipaludibacillus neizhouensis]